MTRPGTAPEKPRFGATCNGCGLCCASEVCAIGLAALGDVAAPCPALRFDGAQFRCMVIETADQMSVGASAMMRIRMGIGFGCDADDAGETA